MLWASNAVASNPLPRIGWAKNLSQPVCSATVRSLSENDVVSSPCSRSMTDPLPNLTSSRSPTATNASAAAMSRYAERMERSSSG